MYRKVLVAGATAAAIVGAGGTALALSGDDGTSSTNGTVATATAAGHSKAKGKGRLLRRMSHAQIVTRNKTGFVTHDLIRGTVTAVSATSITVQAADKTTQTFVVNGDTKVRQRTSGKGAAVLDRQGDQGRQRPRRRHRDDDRHGQARGGRQEVAAHPVAAGGGAR